MVDYSHLDPDLITPGALDARAEAALLRGGCMALAIALHDETGWPIVVATEAYNVHDGRAGGGSAAHWLVQHPSGLLVDVLGLHDPEDVLLEYDEGGEDEDAIVLAYSTRADALEWYEDTEAQKLHLDVVRSFVPPLLKRVEHDIEHQHPDPERNPRRL